MEGQPAIIYDLHFDQLQISVVDEPLFLLSSPVFLGSSFACACVPFKDGLCWGWRYKTQLVECMSGMCESLGSKQNKKHNFVGETYIVDIQNDLWCLGNYFWCFNLRYWVIVGVLCVLRSCPLSPWNVSVSKALVLLTGGNHDHFQVVACSFWPRLYKNDCFPLVIYQPEDV